MSDEAHLVPIPDPLDLDAPDFTDEHRREIVEWAVKTSRDALDPDRPEELLRVFPYAVIVLQFETALRRAEARVEALRGAAIWMSGSPSFGPDGEAGEAFRRDVLPLLNPEVAS